MNLKAACTRVYWVIAFYVLGKVKYLIVKIRHCKTRVFADLKRVYTLMNDLTLKSLQEKQLYGRRADCLVVRTR